MVELGVQQIFRETEDGKLFWQALSQWRPRLQRLSRGLPYFEVREKEAVALGLITPPKRRERKVEDPPRSGGKPLSYYLKQVRE